MNITDSYRAPRGDGEALIAPPLGRVVESTTRNIDRAKSWSATFGGWGIDELRAIAREQLVQAALRYTSAYRNVFPLIDSAAGPGTRGSGSWSGGSRHCGAIVMAGHQPTLFHPGVWFKNFALDEAATRLRHASGRAVAINLVIDNDVASVSSIRVPRVDRGSGMIRQESIAYDRSAGGIPLEQCRIRDRELFDSFGDRVVEAIRPMSRDPVVGYHWPEAIAAANRCESISCAIAAARHALEARWGLNTLELPLSVACRGEPFAAFILGLLADLPRFHETYNSAVYRYRQLHGIRSAAHPVPNLARSDDWFELPLWIYGDDSPQRRGAWARKRGDELEISDRHSDSRVRSIRLTSSVDCEQARDQLSGQLGPRFKLRPRALITTMYARLILSDLFIHGIGGATYDALGDQIAAEFFGLEPPEMMVVSATIRLTSLDRERATPNADWFRNRIRQTRFAPESFSDEAELPRELIEAKRDLLRRVPPRGQKLAWHQELTRVNRELSMKLDGLRERLGVELGLAKHRDASDAILQSREHSFCLFDRERLADSFKAMLGR